MCRLPAILLLFSTPALWADLVSFSGLPGNTDYGTFNGFSSGSIDGVPFDDLICDDWSHVTYFPSGTLYYKVSVLNSLQYARFVTPGGPTQADIENYEAAAILVQGLINNPGQVADYQYALWELFTPDTPNYAGANTLLTNALNLVEYGDTSGDADLFSRLRIYTPVEGSVSNQEFLQIDAPAPVPEPSGVVLLLTVAVGFIVKSRIRQNSSTSRPLSPAPDLPHRTAQAD